jgi:hypothetical protein
VGVGRGWSVQVCHVRGAREGQADQVGHARSERERAGRGRERRRGVDMCIVRVGLGRGVSMIVEVGK